MTVSKDDIELRSENVQEILKNPPHWMLRYGNFAVFITIILLLLLSWSIKYPDVVKGNIIITTVNAPERIMPKNSGRVDRLLVKNGAYVTKGTPIAILENNANYKDILKLKKLVAAIKDNDYKNVFPISEFKNAKFGEIANFYYSFVANYENNQSGLKKMAFKTDNNSRLDKNSLNILIDAIDNWEFKYVLKSSTSGRVSFFNIWSENQIAYKDEVAFIVIPDDNGHYIGKVKVKSNLSGKIKVGQKVQIRLDDFPSEIFGSIEGTVSLVSVVYDKEKNIWLDVALNTKLVTNYNKTLLYRPEMEGTAEIITKDERLIERVISHIGI